MEIDELWGWGDLDDRVRAGFETDGGLVQEGDLWVTGTGVKGERALWDGLGWGCFLGVAGAEVTWGLGVTGQGSDCVFVGWGGTGVGGEKTLLASFSTGAADFVVSSGLTKVKHTHKHVTFLQKQCDKQRHFY